MFAFHRCDPRKTPEKALEAIDVHASMFLGDEPATPGTSEWALRLYDLAFLIFEVQENLGGQEITAEQRDRAHGYITAANACALKVFPYLAHPARLDAGFASLKLIVDRSAGMLEDDKREMFDLAHVCATWLHHTAHNAYLDWKCMQAANPGDAAPGEPTGGAVSPLTVPGIVWVPYVNPMPQGRQHQGRDAERAQK